MVREGDHGALVVYTDRFTKTENNAEGQETEREIPFMKGYTVFNVERIDGLPETCFTKPAAGLGVFVNFLLELFKRREASNLRPLTAEHAPHQALGAVNAALSA